MGVKTAQEYGISATSLLLRLCACAAYIIIAAGPIWIKCKLPGLIVRPLNTGVMRHDISASLKAELVIDLHTYLMFIGAAFVLVIVPRPRYGLHAG